MSNAQTISHDSKVVMHFSLSLEDGSDVISTFEEEPMVFTLGDGTMAPALESKLIGLKAGEEQSLLLSGNDVYGAWDSENRQWIDTDDFPHSLELSPGQVIAFTTPAGQEVAGTVLTIETARILLDFNHPLSGRTFIFRTAILQVDEPE